MPQRRSAEVVFYWRPGCPFCYSLRLRLRRARLPIREVNIWTDDSAAQRVRTITGGDETVPTVVVGSTAMVNPRPAEVLDAVSRHAPELLEPRAAAPARADEPALRRLRPRGTGS